MVKEFHTDHVITRLGDFSVALKLEDLSGQEDYDRLRLLGYIGSDVLLLGFTFGVREELDEIESKWCPEARHFCPDKPIILVGIKNHEAEEINMPYQEAKDNSMKLAREIGAIAFVPCHPDSGENLMEVFEAV
jgi:Ras homolog gene family, member A